MAIVVPAAVGVIVAKLVGRRGDTTMANVLGSGVILLVMILFFAAEYIEVTRFQIAWIGVPYKVRFGYFNRYAIYGFVAFADIALLYVLGLRAEERWRRRNPVR